MEHPAWLNKAFLETVLQGGQGKEPHVAVINYVVSPGVSAGNNCTSNLYRVEIKFKTGHSDAEEQITILIKAPLTQGFFSEMDIYTAEPKIYNQLLPKMFQKGKYRYSFGPKSFFSPIKNVVILEDLRPKGYIMNDKVKQLSFDECRLVLVNLGKFHATSVAIYHDDPDYVKALGEEGFFKNGDLFEKNVRPWLEHSTRHLCDVLSEMGGQQWFINWLISRVDKAADSIIRVCKPRPNGFNVINHGDCWTNNILFKYDTRGEVIDCKFIDFQIFRFATPVLDVVYFIWTSARQDVLENNLEQLFDTYISTLNSTLKQLGCEDKLTVEQFKDEIRSSSDWFFFVVPMALSLILCPQNELPDMEKFSKDDFESDRKFVNMFYNERYKAQLPAISKQLQRRLS